MMMLVVLIAAQTLISSRVLMVKNVNAISLLAITAPIALMELLPVAILTEGAAIASYWDRFSSLQSLMVLATSAGTAFGLSMIRYNQQQQHKLL
jgi:hypothetical protein